VLAAAVAGYVGLSTAALACGIELGIQPDLFNNADGAPLYSPYHLSQAVPAMLLAHLAVASVVEAALTAGVLAYLQRANLPLLRANHPAVPLAGEARVRMPLRMRPLHVALGAVAIMILLTPIGLLAPGGAFGEDAPEDLDLAKYHLSAIPTGLEKWNGFWHHAVFNGYDFTDDAHPTVGYLVSAVVGIAVIGAVVFLVTFAVSRFSTARHGRAAPGTPGDDAEVEERDGRVGAGT
jgi:cobalt/nickel transport system permease protein